MGTGSTDVKEMAEGTCTSEKMVVEMCQGRNEEFGRILDTQESG